jgi:hypothetical protein
MKPKVLKQKRKTYLHIELDHHWKTCFASISLTFKNGCKDSSYSAVTRKGKKMDLKVFLILERET